MKLSALTVLGILATAGAAPILISLPACTPGATTQTQVQLDAGLITAGITAVAPAILADPKLSPADAATIRSAVATVQAANAVVQGATAATGGPVQQIAAAVRLLAPLVVSGDPSSPQVIAVNAAVALLPVLLQAAGLPPAAMATMRPGMPAAEARMVLKGISK